MCSQKELGGSLQDGWSQSERRAGGVHVLVLLDKAVPERLGLKPN